MKRTLFRNEDGVWNIKPKIKKDNYSFFESQLKYMNKIDPLFKLAREKCEFEFILILLGIRGVQDAGWDPFENLVRIYESFKVINKKRLDESIKVHYVLFTYGLIVEASMPYEFLANLLNIIEGGRYRVDNFPGRINERTKRIIPQSPWTKISKLKSRAENLHMDLSFFDEFADNRLRNAIFHSDYSVYGNEIRILDFPPKRYTHTEWFTLMNKALAYMESFLQLYYVYIGSYREPELIDVHPDFGHHPNEKATTIIRKGYGLVGIKDIWTPEQLAQGYIPYRLDRPHRYEIPLIEKGELILPYDRIKTFNNRIKYLPIFLRRYLVKKFGYKFR
jgi:hypothetical protein